MSTSSYQIAIFPLKTVLLPGAVMPLRIFEPRYKTMLADCKRERRRFGINYIRQGEEVGAVAVPYKVGTEVRIVESQEEEQGGATVVLAAGGRRYRIRRITAADPYIRAEIDLLHDASDVVATPDRVETERLSELGGQLMRSLALIMEQQVEEIPEDPGILTWFLAARLSLEAPEQQTLLELTSVRRRVQMMIGLLEKGLPEVAQKAAAVREVRMIRRGNGNVFRPGESTSE